MIKKSGPLHLSHIIFEELQVGPSHFIYMQIFANGLDFNEELPNLLIHWGAIGTENDAWNYTDVYNLSQNPRLIYFLFGEEIFADLEVLPELEDSHLNCSWELALVE